MLNLFFGLQTKDTRFEIYRPWDSAVACDHPNFISGSYQSCGSKFRVWNGNYIEVQPGDGVYKAYDVHQFPRIQWHAAKSELDSLIVYDVGNLYVHGIYVNIVRGEISSGQVRSYRFKKPTQKLINNDSFTDQFIYLRIFEHYEMIK